ncbi:hypothetical protein FDECE_5914 [Fusarium decemcellulare]|nr:hypothetical protein FDECE_5914 [Fusarium decemcellulare]
MLHTSDKPPSTSPDHSPNSDSAVLAEDVAGDSNAEGHDGGYGWVVVVSQLLITANTWGVNGITLAAPLVTYASKRLGTRPTLSIGIVLETGGLVAASFATRTWHLFLTQGLLFGWGCSFLYIGTYGIIPQWFTRRTGLASGIASAGSGLGGLVHSLASQAMISQLGLAWSFRITAICTAVVHVVCTIFMRDRNKHIEPQQHSFDLRVLKNARFLLIILWACFSATGYTIVLFSLPNNTVSIGSTAQKASIVGSLANLGMAIGRPFVGLLGDRVGRVHASAGATLVAAILSFCMWTSAKSLSVLLAFSILSGTVIGTFWATLGPVLVDAFEAKQLPTTLSVAWTLISIPTTFAEAIALSLRRSTSSEYRDVQIFTACMFVGGFLSLLLLRVSQQIRSSTRREN